jgi:hypothetical protein
MNKTNKEKGEHKRGGAHTWVPRCRGYCMLRARMMVLVFGCLAAMPMPCMDLRAGLDAIFFAK